MKVENYKNLLEEFNKDIKFDHELKKKTWFNIGGKSKIFYKANNLKDLVKFLKIIENKEKIFILGAGSNTLIPDHFFDDYAHHPTEIKEVLNGVKDVYKDYKKVCIFQPHRISRLKDLRKEFSHAFKNADEVILCPIFTAGEKIKLGFQYLNFAKEIIKNSKVKLFMVENQFQIAKFIKQNFYGKKIVIGMGAGSISSWMRELPKLI